MRKTAVGECLTLVVMALFGVLGQERGLAQSQSQAYSPRAVTGRQANPSNGISEVPYTLDQEYLEWPLPPGDEGYGSIDGRHLKQYVADLVAIPERYRDQGHQFWGRITGTSADAETQQWLLTKLRAAGLSDVHAQPLDLSPQWIPQSWKITATSGGKSIDLGTAQPAMSTQDTPAGGVDLETVYVGLGSEADFAGRDVRGKAVLIYSATRNHQNTTAVSQGAARLADKKGAAAIIIIFALPGHVKSEFYNPGTHVPTFTVGLEDGVAVRDMIAASPDQAPHVNISLHSEMVPGKTADIWGTLPGTSNENIYLIAHRDGFFDGAVDDGTGMASLVGLAEYFAKIPREQRRRTIYFVATTGHHGNGANGKPHVTESGVWFIAHHEEVFKNTALLVNLEHTATSETEDYLPGGIRTADTQSEPLFWFVRGSSRLTEISYKAYREFGVPIYSQPDAVPYGEIDGFTQYAPSIQLTNMGTYSHTDHETLDVVPWTGLEGVTRAYAKIIAEVNKVDIRDLQWPGSTGSANDGR
ncbi:MAG TPA: M28 family peptidase [Acidobacteriaceae bacterium]|nr:M28 family peptidase [Acidobacteriaceae bacterium]